MIDVRHLAELAQLSLLEDEAAALTRDLERIVAYVDELSTIDVSSVSAETGSTIGALRDDVPAPSLSQEEALRAAPRAEDGGFIVPPFVDV